MRLRSIVLILLADSSVLCPHQIHSLVLEMILSGQSPENVDSVLKLSHSVRPHELSAAALYKEALQCSLSSSGKVEDINQLEVIMKSVSEHENTG